MQTNQLDMDFSFDSFQQERFSVEQVLFIKKVNIPLRVRIRGAEIGDDQFIETNSNKWMSHYGGKIFSFNFSGLSVDEEKFSKWIIGKFLQSYSISYSHVLFHVFKQLLQKNSDQITFKNLLNFLESLVSNDSVVYYAFKRCIQILVELNFPEFAPDFLYDFENIKRPVGRDWSRYYELDLKIKPYDNTMIRNGILKASAIREQLKTQELLDACTLAIFYGTGCRPIQAFRLQEEDVVRHGNGLYAVRVPYAKKIKITLERILIQLPEETALLLFELIKRRDPQDQSSQLLRPLTGESRELSHDFIELINRQIIRFAPKEIQQSIKNGDYHIQRFLPYDFRHNLAHSLAMSGATADDIAYILGHSTTVVARHYISAVPELAFIKQSALGKNAVYKEMIGMIITGEIVNKERWQGKQIAGMVDHLLFNGLGGCAAKNCIYQPVRSCYGCNDFCPFSDAPHHQVLDAITAEVETIIELSEATGCLQTNPLVREHEQTIFEIKSTIRRCELFNGSGDK